VPTRTMDLALLAAQGVGARALAAMGITDPVPSGAWARVATGTTPQEVVARGLVAVALGLVPPQETPSRTGTEQTLGRAQGTVETEMVGAAIGNVVLAATDPPGNAFEAHPRQRVGLSLG